MWSNVTIENSTFAGNANPILVQSISGFITATISNTILAKTAR